MKIGIVSDTHSNLHALTSVLEHMEEVGVDKKVHLGNVVGYGPRPEQTLELTLEEFNYIAMGNHDIACVDESKSWGFNPLAKEAIDWTRNKLSKQHISVLKDLQYAHKLGDMLFIHGNPADHSGYILDHKDAKLGFANPIIDFKVAFVGHTYSPFVWREDSYERPIFERTLESNNHGIISAYEADLSDGKSIINVGSVGQSRDGDNRATYAIYDTETNSVTLYKIPYPVDRTIGLMQREGFSEKSWKRLLYGS